MTCSVCGDSLNGTYFTFLNKLICERDYNVSVPELANIDARANEITYLLYFCILFVPEQNFPISTISTLSTAAECSEDVQRVRVPDLGRVLHPGQRQGGVRSGLQGNIPTLSTVITDNPRQKTLDICKKCSRPVEGKLVKLSGSVYHPQCFSCQVKSHKDQG